MKYKLINFKSPQKNIKDLECLNCGQPMNGHENFCSFCGQKNTTKKLSFTVFINNLFSGFFSYDSRFWRTFIPLLFKPGKVSKEYIQGKRVKFVNPFQLYLNVSIIFFIILGVSNSLDKDSTFNNVVNITQNLDSLEQVATKKIDSAITNVKENALKDNSKDSLNQQTITDLDDVFNLIKTQKKNKQLDSIEGNDYVYYTNKDSIKYINIFNKISDFSHFYENHKTYTTQQALDSLGYEKTFWNKFYYQSTVNGSKKIDQFKRDRGASFYKNLMSKISIALFLFLPVFAMFLLLLYIRKSFTYMEHLVFVFHTQTVFFLLLSIFFLLDFFIELSNVTWVFILLFLIYLYKALRNFYMQSRIITMIKFILLNSYYLFLATIGFLIVGVVTFLIN
mgnify:CR=1 FL=1